MTGFWAGVVLSIITGAVVNEFCDLSPWLAGRLIRFAARTWSQGDPDQAAIYDEEWAAIIETCPGKLTKLVLATRFACGAIYRFCGGAVGRRLVLYGFRFALATTGLYFGLLRADPTRQSAELHARDLDRRLHVMLSLARTADQMLTMLGGSAAK